MRKPAVYKFSLDKEKFKFYTVLKNRVVKTRKVLQTGMFFANEKGFLLRCLYASAIIALRAIFTLGEDIGLSIFRERFFYVLFTFGFCRFV